MFLLFLLEGTVYWSWVFGIRRICMRWPAGSSSFVMYLWHVKDLARVTFRFRVSSSSSARNCEEFKWFRSAIVSFQLSWRKDLDSVHFLLNAHRHQYRIFCKPGSVRQGWEFFFTWNRVGERTLCGQPSAGVCLVTALRFEYCYVDECPPVGLISLRSIFCRAFVCRQVMDLLFRVTTVSPLNSRDQGRCYSHKVMASQMVAIQQFRCILLPTHASRFVQRIASSSSWMRVYADAGPSTNYVSGERTTSIRSRSCNLHTAREEIQGLGIKSCMYDGVRISSKWKSQPRGRKHNRNGGIARASMRLDPGGGKPDGENGIGRVVVNLAIAGGLTYLTITGKLGWLFDAFVSLWVSSHFLIFETVYTIFPMY